MVDFRFEIAKPKTLGYVLSPHPNHGLDNIADRKAILDGAILFKIIQVGNLVER